MPIQDRSELAVRAALEVAEAYGVRAREPYVLSDGANLLLHLRPAPIIARVTTLTGQVRPDIDARLVREVSLVEFLYDLGAPVVPPSPELPAGPHRSGAVAFTFWTFVDHPVREVADVATVGVMLRELHQALRGYPGELPYLATPLVDIARYLEPSAGLASIGDDDRARLAEAFSRIAAAVNSLETSVQPVHGDAHPGNMLHTSAGWCWVDFEDACSAPVGWDLACLALTSRLDGREALPFYGDRPSDDELAPLLALRRLHTTVWANLMADRFPRFRDHAEERLAEWR